MPSDIENSADSGPRRPARYFRNVISSSRTPYGHLPCPDLENAKEWWSNFLGVEPYFDEPFYVGFNVEGYELGLLPDADPADGAQTYWGVADVRQAVERAIAHGAIAVSAVADVGDGIVTATVRTPSGSVVGFFFNPHFMLS